jgi:transposase InsO family protein
MGARLPDRRRAHPRSTESPFSMTEARLFRPPSTEARVLTPNPQTVARVANPLIAEQIEQPAASLLTRTTPSAAIRARVMHSTWEGWLYVATVPDVFSRRVIGWAMADHLRESLVGDALRMAVATRAAGITAQLLNSGLPTGAGPDDLDYRHGGARHQRGRVRRGDADRTPVGRTQWPATSSPDWPTMPCLKRPDTFQRSFPLASGAIEPPLCRSRR